MRVDHPRFDEPSYTIDADALFDGTVPGVVDPGPLPELFEPPETRVEVGSDEPMVPVVHRRIRVLANYWHAGWRSAIPSTWLRAGAFDRLAAVAESLPDRWGLAVFDAWRSLELQSELYNAAYENPALPEGYVAPPCSDPSTPPPHLTGGAVDLTLTFDGIPIAPKCGFDEMSAAAAIDHLEDDPCPSRVLRRVLFRAMADQGFVVYRDEWWHFEYGTRRWAAITDARAIYGPATPEL